VREVKNDYVKMTSLKINGRRKRPTRRLPFNSFLWGSAAPVGRWCFKTLEIIRYSGRKSFPHEYANVYMQWHSLKSLNEEEEDYRTVVGAV